MSEEKISEQNISHIAAEDYRKNIFHASFVALMNLLMKISGGALMNQITASEISFFIFRECRQWICAVSEKGKPRNRAGIFRTHAYRKKNC